MKISKTNERTKQDKHTNKLTNEIDFNQTKTQFNTEWDQKKETRTAAFAFAATKAGTNALAPRLCTLA